MSKEGNNYRDEFIQAMDDLQFRLAHKDEVEVLEAGGNGLTIRDCFFHTGHLEDKLNDFFLEHCFCDKEYDEDECLRLDTPIGKINRFDTNFEIAYERDEPEEVKNEYNCLWAIMPTMAMSNKEEEKGE